MNILRISTTPVCLILFGFLLSGCASLNSSQVSREQTLTTANSLLPEAELLDVWIEVFDPEPAESETDSNSGTTPEIRKAESRYIPVHLKHTLEQTGYWGAVRVVPQEATGGEVLVKGDILESDGEVLELRIRAHDARGAPWLDRIYRAELEPSDYAQLNAGDRDPFQSLYNTIANDLIEFKKYLPSKSLQDIRRVAELRFAADLAPRVFADYLEKSDNRFLMRRLPAEDDPMVKRIRTIRERDFLLIDTVNNHYDTYYRDLRDPYDNWREFRMDEAENLRRIERQALTRKILGIGAILGAIALEVAGGNSTRASTATLRNAMIIGGVIATKSGFDLDSEKQIHIDAMDELDDSFESEATPMVVEVDGENHRLTGSAEDQYAEWRILLHKIHATETGLPDSEN